MQKQPPPNGGGFALYPGAMVRYVERRQRRRDKHGGIVYGAVYLEEQAPRTCTHGVHHTGHLPCPTCGLDVVHYWCGHGCPAVVDGDHVHGDATAWATVVRLDGTVERVER